MRVALDASYSIDSQPSGIAVYSQQILSGLAQLHPEDRFVHCYRPKQFRRRPSLSSGSNVEQRCLLPLLPTFRAKVFHALNQRLDRRLAARTVSTFHDLFVMTGEYSSPEFRERFSRQARTAAAHSDLIIAVSEFTAEQVTTLLGIDRARIRVVPHGVKRTTSKGNISREPMILFVGALQIRKNIARLVEAFESLPAGWKLVLAGSGGGYKAPEILRRIEASERSRDIEVTGYVSRERLDELFARASIFAFPSLDEGFGIPVLEAMAAGVPVVTSENSALEEIGKGAAMLVDPVRAESIADGLRRLIADDQLRASMIAAGYERSKAYTWRRSIEATYNVYKELVE